MIRSTLDTAVSARLSSLLNSHQIAHLTQHSSFLPAPVRGRSEYKRSEASKARAMTRRGERRAKLLSAWN